MSDREAFWPDAVEEFDVSIDNDEAIDNIVEKVFTANLGSISDQLSKKFALELSEDRIERIILDYDLDIYSDRLVKDIYNLYMKDY